jgi:hypothetical protein
MLHQKNKRISNALRERIKAVYQTHTNKECLEILQIPAATFYLVIKQEKIAKKVTARLGEVRIQQINGKPRKVIKLATGKQLYHRYLWEQAHGPLLPGQILRCKDGNFLNCDLANFYVRTRAEQVKDNYCAVKASESHRKLWKRIKLREQLGMSIHFTKHRSKRKTTHTPVFAHAPNAHITF